MLSGKLALITGAGSGIGKVACQLFAKEGCNIIAADCDISRCEDTLATLIGKDHSSIRLDVSDSKEVSNNMTSIISKYSTPPNILVNAAGIIRDNFLLNLSESEFEQVLNVNLKGTFLVTQKICGLLVEQNLPGSIVNISSIVGKKGNRGQCNYSASKAGVIAFSKSVALEMAKHSIRCNTVVPGFISTPMTENVPNKVKELFTNLIPVRRFGTPKEVAEVIMFLASEKSSYVTGTEIYVTGGFE